MHEYKAKVVRWVDGDTLILEIDLGFYVKREERIRLARIDTPELRNSVPFRKRRARYAKSIAEKFCIPGSNVTVKTRKNKRDMYARYIAEVYFGKTNLSDYLLEQDIAKKN